MGKGSGSGCGAFVHRRPQVSPVVGTPSKQALTSTTLTPKGLVNVGNTCYANATLQCLLSTALTPALLDPQAVDTFRRYSSNSTLLSLPNGVAVELVTSQDSCDSLSDCASESRKESKRKKRAYRKLQNSSQWLTRELTNMTKEYTSPLSVQNHPWWMPVAPVSSVVINPANITRHPDKLSDCLRPYRQEDAHEFLRALLSTLTMNGHNTQLSSLFDGLLESDVTCLACQHSSMTRDRYMDLSLDISHESTLTLADALEEFTKTEVLDGDNCVYCLNCKEKQHVTKGLRLATAPSILVCHLKRFAFDKYGNLSRLHKTVDFPQEMFIGEYMSKLNKSKPPAYTLVGVLVHEGSSCDSGHYLAYVKSGGEWYKANDSVVSKVDIKVVLNQQAYVLLYEVAGMRHEVTKVTDKEESIETSSEDEPTTEDSPVQSDQPRDSNVTSSLLSFLCGASELNDSMMREFCWSRNATAGDAHLDDVATSRALHNCSGEASRPDTSLRAMRSYRKSHSASNLMAQTRSYRASTLSPTRRERFTRVQSYTNSDPGLRSYSSADGLRSSSNTDSGTISLKRRARKAKLRPKGSPLPPRPADYKKSSASVGSKYTTTIDRFHDLTIN